MKRKRTTMTDLNTDVLGEIMYRVAVSSNGARNLIAMSSVCRMFKEISEEDEILEDLCFHHMKLSDLHESFWQPNGLLCKCLQNGNGSALDVATKYAEMLTESYKEHETTVLGGLLIIMLRTRAVEIVNTRSRRKALTLAEDEYKKLYEAADAVARRRDVFLEMMRTVIRPPSDC